MQQHPERLGKYVITEVLGEGAMGIVYKGYDPDIGRQVAVKTIRRTTSPDQSPENALLDRFRNEARAVGRLNHPGIVAIYELGQSGDIAYIAMEFVDGRDLSQLLSSTPKLPEPVVLRIMHQLLDALECAHQQGVWHRDIKPANLIITAVGQLKITDFGIARIESAALTQVTSAIGTPGYMAPEQYIGEKFDHRVDIFAAGVLLYRMLAGQAPFTGSAETVMYSIMNKDPASLGQFIDNETAAFYDPIIALALAKDPSRRFDHATGFREALLRRNSVATASAAETTIIVQSVRIPQVRPTVQLARDHSIVSISTQQMALTGWDEQLLGPVQSALANILGPMAKVLVRQAARKCNDLNTLIATVSQDIPHAADQARFLALLQNRAAPGTLVCGVVPPQVGTTLSTQTVPKPLNASLIDHAHLLMTRHIGPIAKIIVRKAAADCRSQAEFVASLAQEIPDGAKRAQFVTDLQSKT